ncbi:acyltransferase [Isosphaeraceae bacterium EP7]
MTNPPPTHSDYLAQKYFSSLDIFRFFSIVAVVWHHSQEGFAWWPGSHNGFLGVDFFFVISGFLIVTLLLRERDRVGRISLPGFYLRRSLRIFPIYYGLITALALVYLLRPGSSTARSFFADLPYQLTYLSNLVPASSVLFFTWSLSTEEQFYLAWPPVERWFPRAALPILVVVLGVNQAINFGLLDAYLGDLRRLYLFQITFTPICLGVLVAHVLHAPRGYAAVVRVLGRPWTPLVLLVAAFGACNIPGDLQGWPRLLIQVVMTLLLTSCVVREDQAVNLLFGAHWLRRIGVISYGMYLYHMFVIALVAALVKRASLPQFVVPFVLSLALTVLVAELSFRYYETPFLRLKDRLGQGADRRGARVRAEVREDRPVETLG